MRPQTSDKYKVPQSHLDFFFFKFNKAYTLLYVKEIKLQEGNPLVVQRLGLDAFTAEAQVPNTARQVACLSRCPRGERPLVELYLEPGGLFPTMHGRVTAPSC